MEFGYMEAQWVYAITSFLDIWGSKDPEKKKQKHSGEANSQNLGVRFTHNIFIFL